MFNSNLCSIYSDGPVFADLLGVQLPTYLVISYPFILMINAVVLVDIPHVVFMI